MTRAEGIRTEKVLVVDDEAYVRKLLTRILAENGYDTVAAEDATSARELLEGNDIALMLCDLNMPGESGLSLLRHVRLHHPRTAALMVTGVDDPLLAEELLDQGAYGYMTKSPFKATELLTGVANALRRRELELAQRTERKHLEQELEAGVTALTSAREETVKRLAAVVEARDAGTGRHVERMSDICALIAEKLGFDHDRREMLREASKLHDVGKVAVPDGILNKPAGLTPEERARMERHAEAGYRLLDGSDSDLLSLAATIARTHHECWDGTGYPWGLRGEEIPLEGRIASVADVFDALTQDRPYRAAYTHQEAIDIMLHGYGNRFDTRVFDALIASLDEIATVAAASAGVAAA
jgi:putative two-component system response regulator